VRPLTPNITFRQALACGRTLPFAHRGAGRVGPENTEAAFRGAVDLGFEIVETDIQASRDGTPYIFHDKSLARLTGDARKLEALSDHEIAAIRVKGDHAVPRLADMFEAFPDTLFNLDAKTWAVTRPLAELILKMNARPRVCIGSFSDARIRAVLDILGPQTCHSVGTMNAVRFFVGGLGGINQTFTADCIQFPTHKFRVPLVTRRAVDYAHRLGMKVHVWTINDPEGMQALLDLGVDGIMTDECALLKQVMTARGHW